MKNVKNKKVILAVIICTVTVLSLAAGALIKYQQAETAGSVLLQINEFKFGYSEAGEPLPDQNKTREFTLAKDDKVYEGLPDKAPKSNRSILTLTDITDKVVTLTLLDNGLEVIKEINYNTEYTYTAFTNPDEYSYVYTITFVK